MSLTFSFILSNVKNIHSRYVIIVHHTSKNDYQYANWVYNICKYIKLKIIFENFYFITLFASIYAHHMTFCTLQSTKVYINYETTFGIFSLRRRKR